MFLSLNFLKCEWILKLVHFEILDQFSYSLIKILEFSHFNQILLNLFNISSVFHNSIWLNIKTKMCQTIQNTILKYVLYIK